MDSAKKLERVPTPAPATEDRATLPAPGRLTELEEKLRRIFAEILGMRRLGAEEDFFEFGGDSLLGIELCLRLERALGREMPLATLYAAPSARKLAAYLCNPESLPCAPGVFPLQPSGWRPPFLFVGGTEFYRPLATRMGPDRPFIGLVLEDAELRALPAPRTLEGMAGLLAKKIRLIQPRGPYFLGCGGCANQFVAYELAQQLRAQGDEVLLVLMAPNPGYALKRPNLSTRVSRYRRRISAFLGKLWTLRSPRKVAGYIRQSLRARLKMAGFGLDFILWTVHRWTGIAVGRRQLRTAKQFAGLSYQPQPFAGQIALIRPSAHFAIPDTWPEDLGWGQLADGGVDVRVVPGRLEEIFVEPRVELTAVELESILMKAQRLFAESH